MSEARGSRRGPRGGAMFAAAATVLLLAACSGAATPVPTSGPPRESHGATAPAGSAAPGASASAGPASTAKVAIDETLMKYLPAAIASFTVSYSAEATNDVVGDPVLVKNAESIAYGLAADQTTGDLVVAAVVKLKAGVMTDSFYRSWRTTYDKAACANAAGVAGNAEAQISNRTTYIGTCNGGAHTYHVYLPGPNVLVPAISVGTKRFGEQLMGTLRP